MRGNLETWAHFKKMFRLRRALGGSATNKGCPNGTVFKLPESFWALQTRLSQLILSAKTLVRNRAQPHRNGALIDINQSSFRPFLLISCQEDDLHCENTHQHWMIRTEERSILSLRLEHRVRDVFHAVKVGLLLLTWMGLCWSYASSKSRFASHLVSHKRFEWLWVCQICAIFIFVRVTPHPRQKKKSPCLFVG